MLSKAFKEKPFLTGMSRDKIVFITGASQGIGREVAYHFAKERFKLVITFNKEKKEADKTAKQCRTLGSKEVLVLQLDVTDDKSIKKCVKTTLSKYPIIDILVNNAGVFAYLPLEKQDFSLIESQVRTNVEGLIKLTRLLVSHIRESIFNVASAAGKIPYADMTTYCATKFAVRGFTQALALERKQIKIYTVNPGTTATRMTNFEGVAPTTVATSILQVVKENYTLDSGSDIDIWKQLGIEP